MIALAIKNTCLSAHWAVQLCIQHPQGRTDWSIWYLPWMWRWGYCQQAKTSWHRVQCWRHGTSHRWSLINSCSGTREIPSHAPEAVSYSPIKATVHYLKEIPRHWRHSTDSQDSQCCHKGGSRGIPKNYRPIALSSHLIKVFEKVLRNHVVAYMENMVCLIPRNMASA